MANHLASFVAAVLKDETVEDVLKENETLKEKLKESQSKAALIEITGEGGSPVYASGDIREGYQFEVPSFGLLNGGGGTRWRVQMTEVQQCPIREFRIRLGGVPLLRRVDLLEGTCWVVDCFNEMDGYGRFGIRLLDANCPGIITSISASFGPFVDYDQYWSMFTMHGLEWTNMIALGRSNPGMGIRFESVVFQLPEILDCLERFGVSKERVTGQEAEI